MCRQTVLARSAPYTRLSEVVRLLSGLVRESLVGARPVVPMGVPIASVQICWAAPLCSVPVAPPLAVQGSALLAMLLADLDGTLTAYFCAMRKIKNRIPRFLKERK
jgi:hypothetical protein